MARIVPLFDDFLEALKVWKAEDEAGAGSADFIVQYRGRPVLRIIKSFHAAVKKAGISRCLRPYDFRHHFATVLLGQNGDLKSTPEVLGHSRTDTTTRIYQHTNIEMHRQLIAKIPPLLPRTPKPAPVGLHNVIKFSHNK